MLAVGMGMFMAVQSIVVVGPLLSRALPPEVDDSFTYLIKASNLLLCPDLKCPALIDLRRQWMEELSSAEARYEQKQNQARIEYNYHPLHSAVLLVFRQIVGEWELAYELLWVLGWLMLVGSLTLWLYSIYSAVPTGIAMLLLSVFVFPGQGVRVIIPSNLALAIALLTWAYLISSRPHKGAILVVGSTLALGFHPIATAYVMVSIALYVLLQLNTRLNLWSWRFWLPVGLCSMLIIWSRWSMRAIPVDTIQQPLGSWESFLFNGGWVAKRLLRFSGPMRIPWLVWTLPFIALATYLFLRTLPGPRRRVVLIQGCLLLGLCVASLLVDVPRYPAETFMRVMVPISFFGAGAVGMLTWSWVSWVRGVMIQTSDEATQNPFTTKNRRGRSSWWIWLGVLGVGVGLITGTVAWYSVNVGRLQLVFASMVHRQPYAFDVAQPRTLLNTAEPGETVFYVSEVPMQFFLVHGATRLGAVYYPLIAGAKNEHEWLNRSDLHYLVDWNPITLLPGAWEGGIKLDAADALQYQSPIDAKLQDLELMMDSPEDSVVIELRFTGSSGEQILVESVPAHSEDWIMPFADDETLVREFSLSFLSKGRVVFLRGLRFDSSSDVHWPWQQQGTLRMQPRSGPVTESVVANFDPGNLFPWAPERVRVWMDGGDTVLARLTPLP